MKTPPSRAAKTRRLLGGSCRCLRPREGVGHQAPWWFGKEHPEGLGRYSATRESPSPETTVGGLRQLDAELVRWPFVLASVENVDLVLPSVR